MISVRIENESEHTALYGSDDEKYQMFKVNLVNNQGSVTFHNFLIFPRCEALSKYPQVNGEYVFEDDKLDVMELFVSLLYGSCVQMSFERLLKLHRFALQHSYSKLEILSNLLYDNIDKLSYTSCENQMGVLLEILIDQSLDRQKIISKSKLAQLKRIAMMTEDPRILQFIIQETLSRYTTDTNAIKKQTEEDKLKVIGLYETRVRSLENEIVTLKQKTSNPYGTFGL